MKLVRNTGADRIIDLLRPALTAGRQLDVVTPALSLFAFADILEQLKVLEHCRLVLPATSSDLALLGSEADRAARNQLRSRWLATRLAAWLEGKAEVRRAHGSIPQGAFVLRDPQSRPLNALLGSLAFTTDGLGLTPGNPLSLIQASETAEEATLLSQWFDTQWSSLQADPAAKNALIREIQDLANHREPSLVYALILYQLFRDRGDDLDEDRIIKSATGIHDTVVWKKLYRFQRDGVLGAIDKLEASAGASLPTALDSVRHSRRSRSSSTTSFGMIGCLY